MDKRIVCICEDITEQEIVEAIREGYDDLETLKRYIGFSTGPCQGKTCLYHVIAILARELKKTPEEIKMLTQRPPTKPISIGILAGESSE